MVYALLEMVIANDFFSLALYKNDRSYRRYASGVERALSLFDTAQQEWADYISFLARLLKVYISLGKDSRKLAKFIYS